ncbi:hypothetical protein FB107DRAFT_270653 [Schizophyllum commune]
MRLQQHLCFFIFLAFAAAYALTTLMDQHTSSVFTCCPGCPVTSEARGGMSYHKARCHIYANWKKEEEERGEIPEEEPRRKKKKKKDLGARLRRATEIDDRKRAGGSHNAPEALTESTPPLPSSESLAPDLMDVVPGPPFPPPLGSVDPANHTDTSRSQDLAGTSDLASRAHRQYRIPAQHHDVLPAAIPVVIPSTTSLHPSATGLSHTSAPSLFDQARQAIRSTLNVFGLFREYPQKPTYDPDALVGPEDLSNIPLSSVSSEGSTTTASTTAYTGSANNATEQMLFEWQHDGVHSKTAPELNKLVHDVLLDDHFTRRELTHFNAERTNRRVDELDQHPEAGEPFGTGFTSTDVKITVPSGDASVPAQKFSVPGLYYRKIVDVVREAFSDPLLASHYHLFPFRLFHRPKTSGSPSSGPSASAPDQRVLTDIYNSDAMLEEHERVQHAELPPDDPHCARPRIVAALMAWSDATHLTNFGTAHVWPIYLMLGNLSKYIRCQPTSGACLHLAYIPSLTAQVTRDIAAFHAKWKTQKKQILTHCKRELMQEVWRLLLSDPEFRHAYRYGMIIEISGVEYRVYPRLFTYSADYPEKILLATIRDLGDCPCPRCLMPRQRIDLMGLVRDIRYRAAHVRKVLVDAVRSARDRIYNRGAPITGVAVERLLKDTSSTPTLNAFVELLDGIDVSRLLVVDFMHEVELGVWKALFTHLIRVLYAADSSLVVKLNERFAQMPTFGVDTIRRFHENVSEMRKLAARDFEDILQCSIPAFEGLLPDAHNKRLLKLLYKMAEWHALAKLRMQTEDTLHSLEIVTRELGQAMREFRDKTCSAYATVETPAELRARQRRAAEKGPASAAVGSKKKAAKNTHSQVPKTLNLFTYKWHALGDYVSTIRLFGPTDNYSTQTGELAHRIVKRLYTLTNKKDATAQIGRAYRRMTRARKAHDLRNAIKVQTKRRALQAKSNTDILEHHHITKSRSVHHSLSSFATEHADDPVLLNFVPKLQDHLLNRLLHRQFDGDDDGAYSDEDRNHVRFRDRSFFEGRTCRVNYTTYDCRRDQDTIHVGKHADIMMHSPETGTNAHPYWYARVLGVYHADVMTSHPRAPPGSNQYQKMQFLFVRWYGTEPGYRSGSGLARLPKIGFVEEDEGPYAFGFLDPALVIRTCHLIPAFASGRTSSLLGAGATIARAAGEVDDWLNYYVNIFADRDIFMRHFGGGIGHTERAGTNASSHMDTSAEPEEVPTPEAAQALAAAQKLYQPIFPADAGDGDDPESDVDDGPDMDHDLEDDEEDDGGGDDGGEDGGEGGDEEDDQDPAMLDDFEDTGYGSM